MIRQASLFGRLLVSVRGKEAAVIRGIMPSASRLSTIDNRVLSCVVTLRTFSVTKELKDENKAVPMKVDKDLESILAKNSTEDVLNAAVSSKLHPQSVILVLRRLTDLKDDSKSVALEKDGRFIQLMSLLETGVSDLSPYNLVESLHYLLQLTREDQNAIIQLEMRVKEMLLQLKFSQLLRVVQMHRASSQTSLRRSVYDEAMTVLERRWVEIMNPKDLVSVLYVAPSDREKLFSNLEQKTLELSEAMNVKDLYRILYLMAKRNRRNIPVIRSLVYHMNRLTLGLTPIQLANLSYACAKLNVYDENIMGKIVEGVLSCKGASVDELSTILRSFGMLQWCDQNLMDGVGERFVAESSTVPPDGWAALLLTAGCVNYLPSHVAEHLPDIISKVDTLQGSNPRLWLDVVWSLLILSRATPSMVSSVLSQGFVSSIKGASQNPIAAYMKLMNINAIARFSLPGYSGPFLDDSLLEEFVKQLPVPSRNTSTDCLIDTLSNMASLDKYVRTNVKTLSGFVLDAEVIVHKSTGELQPVGDKGSFVGSSNSLPESLNRVAIKLLEFGDMTRGTSIHPTGLHALHTKCLTSIGYKIVQIPYEEFNMKMTTVQRVQYLNMKIKEALGLPQTLPQISAAKPVVLKAFKKASSSLTASVVKEQQSIVDTKSIPIPKAVATTENKKPLLVKAFKKASSSLTAPVVKEGTEQAQHSIVDTKSIPIHKSVATTENKNAFVRPTIKDILDVDSSPESIKMAQIPLEKTNSKANGSTEKMKDKKPAKKPNLKEEKSHSSASESAAESQSKGITSSASKQESS